MPEVDSVAGPIYSFLHYVIDAHLSCLISSSLLSPLTFHAPLTTPWVRYLAILDAGACAIFWLHVLFHEVTISDTIRDSMPLGGLYLFQSFASSRTFVSFSLNTGVGLYMQTSWLADPVPSLIID